MLFALPSYKFPYIVMNRCLLLKGDPNWDLQSTQTSKLGSVEITTNHSLIASQKVD
jgi:hypothetical protein